MSYLPTHENVFIIDYVTLESHLHNCVYVKQWIILYAKSSHMSLSNVLYTPFHLCETVKSSVFGSGEALY